jgi:hypothetical protein
VNRLLSGFASCYRKRDCLLEVQPTVTNKVDVREHHQALALSNQDDLQAHIFERIFRLRGLLNQLYTCLDGRRETHADRECNGAVAKIREIDFFDNIMHVHSGQWFSVSPLAAVIVADHGVKREGSLLAGFELKDILAEERAEDGCCEVPPDVDRSTERGLIQWRISAWTINRVAQSLREVSILANRAFESNLPTCW